MQQELLRLANSKKEYGDVADETHKLRERRQVDKITVYEDRLTVDCKVLCSSTKYGVAIL
ncbi:MAG: hypothetical protein NC419_04395 [Muribaculaceae bacterium]|nr:hypothetical protein [Muribaculaceae bacterium]